MVPRRILGVRYRRRAVKPSVRCRHRRRAPGPGSKELERAFILRIQEIFPGLGGKMSAEPLTIPPYAYCSRCLGN